MLSIFDSILLGAVQGLTEFLPVSSSGHLILAREVLHQNTSGGLAFDAVLQLGTIVAVIIYFRHTILNLIRDALRIVSGQNQKVKQQDRRLLASLIVGTIPAFVLGIALEDLMQTAFRSPLLVAIMLIAGSILFIAAERASRQTQEHPTVTHAWWIGCFQALALIPGVSRSGATISGGLLFGLTREAAARYSFLLSFPIIAGTGLKKLIEVLLARPADIPLLQLSLSFVTACLVGLVCIHFLLTYLKNHTLYLFVWYRLALAAAVLFIIWQQ